MAICNRRLHVSMSMSMEVRLPLWRRRHYCYSLWRHYVNMHLALTPEAGFGISKDRTEWVLALITDFRWVYLRTLLRGNDDLVLLVWKCFFFDDLQKAREPHLMCEWLYQVCRRSNPVTITLTIPVDTGDETEPRFCELVNAK